MGESYILEKESLKGSQGFVVYLSICYIMGIEYFAGPRKGEEEL